MISNSPQVTLTPEEQAEWDRLSAWWLTWTPPNKMYTLSGHIRVTDVSAYHAYYADRIREGCRGLVQRGVLWVLKENWKRFGEKAE